MTSKARRILLVEDDKVDQMAFKRMVGSQNLMLDYVIVGSIAEAVQTLETDTAFDAIVLDYHLGDGTAFDILDTIDLSDIPTILATGTGDEETAVKALKSGMHDYLIKDPDRHYLKILPATVEQAISRQSAADQITVLSQAVMSTSDSIFITNMMGKLTFVNRAFCNTYGYAETEILGQPEDVLQTAQARKETMPFLETPSTWQGESFHKRSDGTEFPVSLSRSIIKDEKGRKKAIVTVVRDISETKQIEQELRELNATKDKFFSIIAHDLRGPFSHIMGFSEVLLEEIDDLKPEEIVNFIGPINSSAKKLYELLENLLSWSRVQTGKIPCNPTQTDVDQLVDGIIDLLGNSAAAKHIQLIPKVDPDLVAVVDRNMISSVIRNLVSNAIKFTDNHGSITIAANEKQGEIEISVTDTGVGMTQEAINKLFRSDTFYSTRGTEGEKGTGLGLVLCQEFVERNGGRLWVRSKPGHGSTFTFTVPAYQHTG